MIRNFLIFCVFLALVGCAANAHQGVMDTETIYTQETIFDNILETQMEHAAVRDEVVSALLRLLKKKRILLL